MELPYRGSGKVYYNNKNYQCDLYYSEELGGIILKIIVMHKKAPGSFFDLPLEIAHLFGRLDTGFRFTLLQLTRTGLEDWTFRGESIYTFTAKYILCGIGNKEQAEQTFYNVDYILSDIIEWGNESVYTIGEKSELINNKKDIRKIIYKDKGVSITYVVCGSSFPSIENNLLKERIEIIQFGAIEIEFEKESVLEQFNNVFSKIKGLMEIATLRRINVEKVVAFSHDVFEKIGNLKDDRAIEIYGENIRKSDLNAPAKCRRMNWIALSELIEYNSFSHYIDKHEKLAPIIELYLELFSVNNISETRAFLNIVQALETYHSRFITNDIKEFKSNIETIVVDQSETEEIRTYMMANSKSFITLESRIADLLIAKRKIYFDIGEIKRIDFPEVIAATRNYYIHYDESIKKKHRVLSEDELQFYNRALIKILEYYILLELGFPVENFELKKKLDDRWGNVSQDLQILRISKTQHDSQ